MLFFNSKSKSMICRINYSLAYKMKTLSSISVNFDVKVDHLIDLTVVLVIHAK